MTAERIIETAPDRRFHIDNEALSQTACGLPSHTSYGIGELCADCMAVALGGAPMVRLDQTVDVKSAEVITLARQWANCEPGSLPDGIARNQMRRLFGLEP